MERTDSSSKAMEERPTISVFGSGEIVPPSREYQTAQQVGCLLGQLGYSIATGGYAGTMEAVSRGARKYGVEVIGVICRAWAGEANEFVTRVIETDNLTERLARLVELGSSGYIVLPGATGTLRELAEVWELMEKHFIPPRPIVCLGNYWKPVISLIGKTKPAAAERICFVDTPGDLARFFPDLHNRSSERYNHS